MSLEDFFNKKSKKKSKKTLNAQELFEQITDGTSRQKSELEKNVDEMTVTHAEDVGEWEPIVNDDIELDFSNIRISDLATAKIEEEQAASNSINADNKSEDSKVVWGGKIKKEEAPESVEEKPAKSGAYIPVYMRANAQNLPNLESTDEFPTLDVAAQEKSKKSVPVDLPDNSWTEVNRSSTSRRKDDSYSGVPAASNSFRSDASHVKYSLSGLRDNHSSRFGDHTAASVSRADTWARGNVITGQKLNRADRPNSKSISSDHKFSSNLGISKPYVIPQSRDIVSFKQENRFAQLDSS